MRSYFRSKILQFLESYPLLNKPLERKDELKLSTWRSHRGGRLIFKANSSFHVGSFVLQTLIYEINNFSVLGWCFKIVIVHNLNKEDDSFILQRTIAIADLWLLNDKLKGLRSMELQTIHWWNNHTQDNNWIWVKDE